MESKLPPEVKERWLTALRSGKYTQGRSALRTSDGYCCLGVLADVYGAPWQRSSTGGYYLKSSDPEHRATSWITDIHEVPEEARTTLVTKAINVSNIYDENAELSAQKYLAKMNDDGYSFSHIADWIEQNL